ncbi:hypothetical protein [Planococcus salinus]|uniref:Uncharacterized protein n=1 Tax=Planococcus salinus TaxID=1848460 RepID=A0A3M8P3D4_9BACL|nr:hypothetical protein [Planococcus salinus]RNF38228.1 hypothetical protein EEX84_15610 [Planococcus salinus]
MEHLVTIFDYVESGNNIYIKLDVFDAQTETHFRDQEVRFLDDLLYGDLVDPKKSPLSEDCRSAVIEHVKNHFER